MSRCMNRHGASPIIGSILLVAITIVISAVLLTLVLSFVWDFDQDTNGGVELPPPEDNVAWVSELPLWSNNDGQGDDPFFSDQDVDADLKEGSITTWIRISERVDYAGILMKGNAEGNDFTHSYGLQMSGPGISGAFSYSSHPENNTLSNDNRRPIFFIAMNNSADRDLEYMVMSPVNLQVGSWYFIATTWSQTMLTIDVYDQNGHVAEAHLTVDDALSNSQGGTKGNQARAAINDAGGIFEPRTVDDGLLVGAQLINEGASGYSFRGDIYAVTLYNEVNTRQDMDDIWEASVAGLP